MGVPKKNFGSSHFIILWLANGCFLCVVVNSEFDVSFMWIDRFAMMMGRTSKDPSECVRLEDGPNLLGDDE